MGDRAAWFFASIIIVAGVAFGSYVAGPGHEPNAAPPNWAEQTTAIATALTAAVLAITAFFALRGLEDARRTRHGQLVADLSRRWAEPDIVKALLLYSTTSDSELTDLARRIGLTGQTRADRRRDVERYMKFTPVPDLLENIGVLEAEGVLSASLIHRLWGPSIISYWAGWKPAIEEIRKYDEPEAEATFTYFERLARRMAALGQREDLV